MTRSLALGLLGLTLLAPSLALAAAEGELATWDQARVSELAQELDKACNAWWLAIREQPGYEEGDGTAFGQTGLIQKGETLVAMSQGLAGHLKAGKGYHDTLDMYKSLKEVVEDSVVQVRRTEIDEPTMAAWNKVIDLMRQLARYYDPKALDDDFLGGKQ